MIILKSQSTEEVFTFLIIESFNRSGILLELKYDLNLKLLTYSLDLKQGQTIFKALLFNGSCGRGDALQSREHVFSTFVGTPMFKCRKNSSQKVQSSYYVIYWQFDMICFFHRINQFSVNSSLTCYSFTIFWSSEMIDFGRRQAGDFLWNAVVEYYLRCGIFSIYTSEFNHNYSQA